jgi:hypothetical protein
MYKRASGLLVKLVGTATRRIPIPPGAFLAWDVCVAPAGLAGTAIAATTRRTVHKRRTSGQATEWVMVAV